MVGAGEADGEGDDDEPHAGAVEHGVGDAGGEALTTARAEHGDEEQRHRAAQRGDGVGNPVDEHRADAARASAGIDVRRGEARPVAGEHGDAEHDEHRADHDGGVLGVAEQPRVDRLGDHPDDEEHHDEPRGDRRPDDERTAHRGTLVAGLLRRLDAEEVQQVRRQQHEAARVDRGDHAAEERQAEDVGVDGGDHVSVSAICVRRSPSESGPVSATISPSALTNSVTGYWTTPRASPSAPS